MVQVSTIEVHGVLLGGDGARLDVDFAWFYVVTQVLKGFLFVPNYGLERLWGLAVLASVDCLFKHFIIHFMKLI